jgi:hypothetical protein
MKEEMHTSFYYAAMISYSRIDKDVATLLQNILEKEYRNLSRLLEKRRFLELHVTRKISMPELSLGII